jgi:hypothetical protein
MVIPSVHDIIKQNYEQLAQEVGIAPCAACQHLPESASCLHCGGSGLESDRIRRAYAQWQETRDRKATCSTGCQCTCDKNEQDLENHE